MNATKIKRVQMITEEEEESTEYDENVEMSPIYPNMSLLEDLALTFLNYKRDGKKTLPFKLPPVDWIQDIMPLGRKSRTPNIKMKKYDGILLHSTGNRKPGSTARANVNYTNTSKDLVSKLNSYHVCIDDKEIVQCIPFDEKAYSAAKFNDTFIAIEVAENGTDYELTTRRLSETWVYAAQLCAYLLHNYCKVPKGKKGSDYIITHAYVNKIVSKSKVCPQNMINNNIPFSFATFCHLVDLHFLP